MFKIRFMKVLIGTHISHYCTTVQVDTSDYGDRADAYRTIIYVGIFHTFKFNKHNNTDTHKAALPNFPVTTAGERKAKRLSEGLI